MQLQKLMLALSTSAFLGLAASGAQAALKLDISAVTSTTTDVTLDAGTYQLSWIGTADGGAYNGWQFNTAASGNWREAFTVTGVLPGQAITVDVFSPTGVYYSAYSTAADALAAARAGSYAFLSATGSLLQGPVAGPLTFVLPTSTTLSFGVPDNLLTDNTGGVSLSITAVPEPEAYALMLAGLAALGVAVRRRVVN